MSMDVFTFCVQLQPIRLPNGGKSENRVRAQAFKYLWGIYSDSYRFSTQKIKQFITIRCRLIRFEAQHGTVRTTFFLSFFFLWWENKASGIFRFRNRMCEMFESKTFFPSVDGAIKKYRFINFTDGKEFIERVFAKKAYRDYRVCWVCDTCTYIRPLLYFQAIKIGLKQLISRKWPKNLLNNKWCRAVECCVYRRRLCDVVNIPFPFNEQSISLSLST